MIDPTPNEIAAIQSAGISGGQYLESIGKTDLAVLTEVQWSEFCTAMVIGFTQAMQNFAAKDQDRLRSIASGNAGSRAGGRRHDLGADIPF